MTAIHKWVHRSRLYPYWAKVNPESLDSVMTTAEELLSGVPRVAFSVEAPGLRVNGMPMDALRGGEVVWDFATMLSDRLIGTLTLEAGLAASELSSFMNQMCASVDKGRIPADHWNRFIQQESIRHISITQRKSVTSDEGESVIMLRGNLKGDRPLDGDQMALLWPALNAMYSAAAALRLSPPDSPEVEEKVLGAVEALLALLSRVRVVTLEVQDDWLMANSQPLPQEADAISAVQFLAGDLTAKGYGSLTLKDGLTEPEVRALVSSLSVPPEDPDVATHLAVILKSNTIRRFLLQQAGGQLETLPLQGFGTPAGYGAPPEPEASPLEENPFQEMPAMPAPAPAAPRAPTPQGPKPLSSQTPEEFLSDGSQTEFIRVLDNPTDRGAANLAGEIMGRFEQLLEDGSAVIRDRALALARRGLQNLKGEALDNLVNRLRAPIKARLPVEGDPVVQQSLAETVRVWIATVIRTNKVPLAAEVIRYAIKPAIESAHLSKEYRAALSSKMRSLGPDVSPLIMQMLTSMSAQMRDSAVTILGALGAPMIPQLVKLITSSNNPEIRKSAAQALKEIGGTAQQDLGKLITASTDLEQARRIFGVLDLAGTGYLFTPVLVGITHPDPSVRDAALSVLERVDANAAAPIVKKLLAEQDRFLIIRAVQVSQRIKMTSTAPDIVKLLASAEDEEIARVCCEYFQAVPTAMAAPGLKRVFDRKGGLLKKGWADRTRAAAVAAAVRIMTVPSAKEIVDAARTDSNPLIRDASVAKG